MGKKFEVRENDKNGSIEKSGLYFEGNLVSNIIPTLEKVQIIVTDKNEHNKVYFVNLKDADGKVYGTKAVRDLKCLKYFEMWGCSDAWLTPAEEKYHMAKLQEDYNELDVEYIYENISGFVTVDGNKILVWGDEILGKENKSNIKLGKACYYVRKYTITDDCLKESVLSEQLKKHLEFWPGISEVLFYSALHCITQLFLVDKGVDAGHLTLLVGPPGHLKTTLAKRYFLWTEDIGAQKTTFQDYILNSKLCETIRGFSGQNFLADDLHTIASSYGRTKQKNRLDELARLATDGSACANIVVTGESIMDLGIFSCLDRILQVKFPHMSSEQLQNLKNGLKELDDNFMPEIARMYVNALVENYDEVVTDIGNFLAVDMTLASMDYTLRVGRHAMFIRLTERLFRKYCCSDSTEKSYTIQLEKALDNICSLQESEFSRYRNEQDRDYVLDLMDVLDTENDYIEIVETTDGYNPDDPKQCCMKINSIYLTRGAMEQCLIQYLGFPVNLDKVVAQLKQHGILEVGGSGDKKRFAGKRHYVLSYPMLKYYRDCKVGEKKSGRCDSAFASRNY